MNSSLINLKLIFVFLLLFVSINTYSANRFWIAGSASNWNNTANWSTTSGGAGGASVPVATDQVFFNANGIGNCNIDAAVNIESIQVNAGYTGAIDLLGFLFTINGTNNNVFAGGTINDTPASSFISITTTGTTTYSGTVFNTGNTVSSGRFNFNGSTFNIASTFTKTGAGNDNSPGGNTFSQDMVFINNSINYLLLGNGTADIFNGNVTLTNNGSNNMYIAHNGAGHSIAGNLILNNNATGAGDYRMFVCAGNTAALTINGNVTVLQNGNATTLRTYFGDQGDIILNGKLNATISGSGTTSDFRIANNTNSLVTISDTLTILNNGSATNNNSYIGNVGDVILNGKVNLTNSGSGTTSQIIVGNNPTSQITIAGICDLVNNNNANTTNRCYLGNQGDVTFNGDLNIINNAGSANSEVYCNYQVNSNNLYNENITVSTTNTTCDGIYFGQNNGSGTLANNKTITIPGVDTVNFVGGQIRFRNFTQTGNTAQSLELASTATYIYNYDANWGGNISFTAPRIVSRGTTYNGTANIEKTGGGSDGSIGGNTFSGVLTLTNSGSGYLLFGNGTADIFQSNVNLINSGSNNLYIAYDGAGHTITGDLVTTNSATGAGDYRIFCGTTTNATLTINGNVTLNNTGNGTTIRTYFPNQADLTLNGTLTINNSATGTNSYMQIADGTNSSLSISGLTTVNNNNTATTNNRIYLGNNGDITFNGVLDLINNSAATNSDIYCNYGANSQNLYNENITVSSTNINSDGISFGRGNGSGILAATKTITIPGVDTVNFIGGDLYFRNFTQTGPTAQTLQPTGTTLFYNYDSQWNGNVDFRSPRHLTQGTTYNGTAFLEKNGATNDASAGGNTFNNDVTFQNIGTAYFMPANGTSNDFNANATYIKSSTGLMYPSYNCTSTYAGNITINANSTIRFGAAGNGRVLFDGNSAQSINIVGATPTPEFRDIQTNNLISDITLNTPVIVLTELDLDNGHIITSSSNLLTMNDNSIVSSAGELAFIDGPMRKVGNDAFDFPVGKNDTAYAPISISAPVGGGHHFTAEYFQINPDSVLPTPYTRFFKDASLNHVSGCEYWILDRTNGASNVDVTLSWNDRSCGVSNLGDLRVARWDGAMWRDHGNGGTTGSNANGTVVTSGPVTTFSPFTLASSTNENPLPIELLSFTAKLTNNAVDLNWITSTEVNNDYFTLQKSKDGLNWIDFAEQEGAGNSNTTISYTDVDYNPFTGTSYYRLKQTDFNGAFSYSHIETITNTKQQINIYPNPTVSELNISNIKANDIVQVFAIDGRLIYNGNSAKIDASNWSKGIYEVVIFNTSNEILERSKIVKQ